MTGIPSTRVPSGRTAGSALLIMLWAVALLSATTLGLAVYLQSGLDEDAARSKAFRARQLAESGLAVGMHDAVDRGDPVLSQSPGPGESFRVRILSEGSRVNINQAIQNEDDTTLLDLFTAWGLDLDQAERVIDSLRDWVDEDDLTRLAGFEYRDYAAIGQPQLPRNEPFRSVEEMALCRGMELIEAARPDWRDAFTTWGDGKIDVNDAGVEILVAGGGLSEAMAQSVVDSRVGLDGVPDTEDDLVFESLDQFRVFLGLGDLAFQSIQDRLTTSSSIERITSTGQVGDIRRTLTAVVRAGGGDGPGGSILAIIED